MDCRHWLGPCPCRRYAALVLNAHVALYMFLGAFFYAVIYTIWLKQRSVWNIVVGGLAGRFAVLAGAAAITPDLAPAPIILALALFLWTPPHFWSLAIVFHKDYAAAGISMLPVVIGDVATARIILVHTIALVVVSLRTDSIWHGACLSGGCHSRGWFFHLAEYRIDPESKSKSRQVEFLCLIRAVGPTVNHCNSRRLPEPVKLKVELSKVR